MASRELNILVAAKGALKAARDIGSVDKATSKLSGTAGRLGKAAAVGIGAGVVIGAAVIGRGVKAGLESLASLENAVSQVQGSIDTMGLAGKVSAQQVATWANTIEADIGAAFDDKDITSATATLIRFGKVTPSNLKPAMVVMTDLAAKTGSVDSAAALLAKALVDPAKAAGKLSKAGVVLTKSQQDQIKAMVKAGKTAEAQTFLINELAKVTKGAAEASVGPYQRSMNVLADVTEDAQRALAVGFLPVITKVRDILTRELGKPGTLKGIEDFGRGLAGGLEKLIDVAIGLPWDQIKTTFQVIGTGSKAMLDAFLGLPPWVQTAVLTAWGTNKLTGGLVTSLASGLIKGVLGMTAGVVNINAASVNGMPGGVPGGGGAKNLLPALGIGALIVAAAVPIGEAFAAALPAEWKGRPGETGMTDAQRLLGPLLNQNKATNPFRGFGGRSIEDRDAKRTQGEADVLERATAAGLKPTADQITRTYNATQARQESAAQRMVEAALANVRATERSSLAIVAAVRGIKLSVTARDISNANVRRPRHVPSSGSRNSYSGWRTDG